MMAPGTHSSFFTVCLSGSVGMLNTDTCLGNSINPNRCAQHSHSTYVFIHTQQENGRNRGKEIIEGSKVKSTINIYCCFKENLQNIGKIEKKKQ